MKLALYGQWEEVSGLIYTFPEKLSPEKSSELPEWAKSLFDPRYVRGIFKGDYCYAVWYNDNGYYYSCIKTNTDSRNGCIMLTLFAGKMVPMDGKQMAAKMRLLLDYCLSKSNYTEIAYVDVSIKAKEIEGLLTQRALPEVASSTSDKEMAYRLYRNEDELGLIMENPNQFAYASFKRVLVLEESSFVGEAVHSQSIEQITDPIKKTYDIRSDSNDVVASKESVMEGEMFSITYRKAGYADEYVEVAAGRSTKYYTIDSNVINLKSSSEAGINFMKVIILQVVDEETNSPIKKWSCKIDGSIRNDARVENADGSVSYRIEPNRAHKIVFIADGYEEKTLELAAGEHGMKTMRLHSSDNSVVVRLQVGKEVCSGSVRMKSNNKLYYPLKRLDEKDKVLQVKRPFFSRRNLVPIIALSLASLLLGGAIGKFVIKGNKTQTFNTPTVDSTAYVELQKELELKNNELNNANQENEFNKGGLSKYGVIMTSVKEKVKKNPDAVYAVLDKNEYKGLLEGNVTDLNVFDQICTELNNIKAEKANGDGSGGTDNYPRESNSNSTNNVDDLFKGFVWDLNAISATGKEGTTFAEKIRSNDISTLSSNKGIYKKAVDQNQTWESIIKRVNKDDFDLNKKNLFGSVVKEELDSNNNKINLKNIWEQIQ